MIFKLSYLNLNLALTLGYLNPALNNSAPFKQNCWLFTDRRPTLHAAKTMRGPRASRALRARQDYKLAYARLLRALALREIIADVK